MFSLATRFEFFLEHFMLSCLSRLLLPFFRPKGCVKKNLGWYYNKKQKTRPYINARGFAVRKINAWAAFKSMKTPWTYFMLDAYCFRLVCVLISMNWKIHKKFKFMKWSKSRIYYLPLQTWNLFEKNVAFLCAQ